MIISSSNYAPPNTQRQISIDQIPTMAQTNLDAFSAGVSGFIKANVLTPLVSYLPTRPNPHVPITVDELAGVLHLPASAPALAAVPGVVPPLAGAAAPPKAAGSVVHTPGTCEYKFVRGGSKGQFCGKPVAPGSPMCNTHLKNAQKKAGGAATAIPGVAPGAIPGGYPAASSVPAAPAPQELTVEPYGDESQGLFKEPTRGFIVRQADTGIEVLCRLDVASNTMVQLNEEEKSAARAMGLVIPGEAAIAAPPPAAVPPAAVPPAAVPPAAVPPAAVPGVPAVPQAAVPGVPAVPQAAVPGVPAVPQAAVPGGPAVPQAAVPAVPQAVPQAVAPPAAVPQAPSPQAVAPPAAVPQAPSPQAVAPPAAVPQAAVPGVPSVPQAAVPGVPSVPQAAVPGVPSVPQAAVPQGNIPAIPQLQ